MATISSGRSAPQTGAPTSHPYSCNTCQVAFRNSDLQKNHMKGDWHRYNLKRRVASLPPITSEVFAERVIQSRASTEAEAGRASFEQVCNVCQKTYYSQNSFRNHVSSQKHKAREAAISAREGRPTRDGDDASSVLSSTFSLGEPQQRAAAEPALSEIVDSDAEQEFTQIVEGMKKTTLRGHDRRRSSASASAGAGADRAAAFAADKASKASPVKRPSNPHFSAAGRDEAVAAAETVLTPPGSSSATSKGVAEPEHSLQLCLFCNYASPSVALNTAHMERFHGMFIPEKEYLVDLEGLLGALQTRIRDDHECISCGKIRADVFAIQTHMRDKAHCKIPYTSVEEQVEIGDFYDFRATYSDSEPDEEDEEEGDAKRNAQVIGRAKLGARRTVQTTTTTTVTGEDGDELMLDDDDKDGSGGADVDGEGWETDSSASSVDSDELQAVRADPHLEQVERLGRSPHHSLTDPRAHHQMDGWHSHAHKHAHAVFYDEYELHLPSGRAVGHRSLNRYYRQNLHNYPSMAEREEQKRLAIEAAERGEDAADATDAMDLDGEGQEGAKGALTRTGTSQGVVSKRPPPRNTLGLAGVSNSAKANLAKKERRAVMAKTMEQDKSKVRHSTVAIGQGFRLTGR